MLRYFVLLPVLDDEPEELGDEELGELGLVVEDEPDVDGEDVDGEDGDDVLGDADGVELLPGRSPTRSVRLSPHAVSRPRLIATANTAVSILFISSLLLVGLRDQSAKLQRPCRYPVA